MNATEEAEIVDAEEVTLEELSNKLDADLEMQKEELEDLQKDFEKIGNPQAIGKLVEEVVWREFEEQMDLMESKPLKPIKLEENQDEENAIDDAEIVDAESSDETSSKFSISPSTLKQLLGRLLQTIIQKLIGWFRSAETGVDSFMSSVKEAIKDFLVGLKETGKATIKSPLEAAYNYLFGPICKFLKSIWTVLKEGYKSIKEAISYIKEARKNGTPFSIMMLEVSKFVVSGLSIAGGVALSLGIESALVGFAPPVFGFQLGSLGTVGGIVGTFFGFVISGIAGALILRQIDKIIGKKLKQANIEDQVDKANMVLATQTQRTELSKVELEYTKAKAANAINERHEQAAEMMRESVQRMQETFIQTEMTHAEMEETKANIEEKLAEIERKNANGNKSNNDIDDILNF